MTKRALIRAESYRGAWYLAVASRVAAEPTSYDLEASPVSSNVTAGGSHHDYGVLKERSHAFSSLGLNDYSGTINVIRNRTAARLQMAPVTARQSQQRFSEPSLRRSHASELAVDKIVTARLRTGEICFDWRSIPYLAARLDRAMFDLAWKRMKEESGLTLDVAEID